MVGEGDIGHDFWDYAFVHSGLGKSAVGVFTRALHAAQIADRRGFDADPGRTTFDPGDTALEFVLGQFHVAV